MPTPEIPLETLKALYRAFCLARFDYSGPYADEQAREAAIEADAQSYWFSHFHGDEKTPLSVLVDAVWVAARESAYTEDEWRVVAGPDEFLVVFQDEILSEEHLVVVLRDARNRWRGEAIRIQHRRTGATDWEKVADA